MGLLGAELFLPESTPCDGWKTLFPLDKTKHYIVIFKWTGRQKVQVCHMSTKNAFLHHSSFVKEAEIL